MLTPEVFRDIARSELSSGTMAASRREAEHTGGPSMHNVPNRPPGDDQKQERPKHDDTEIREPRQHPQEPAVDDPPADPVQDVPVEEPSRKHGAIGASRC